MASAPKVYTGARPTALQFAYVQLFWSSGLANDVYSSYQISRQAIESLKLSRSGPTTLNGVGIVEDVEDEGVSVDQLSALG